MKKFLTVLLSALMVITMSAPAAFAASFSSFSDASGHWASGHLERAVSDGVLSGSSGKLDPDGPLSGGQMATIIAKDRGLQVWDKAYPGTSASDWYYRSAAAVYSAGILPSDGSIPMASSVTREQVFEVLSLAYYGMDPYAEAEKRAAEEAADTTGKPDKKADTAKTSKTDKTAGNDTKAAVTDKAAEETAAADKAGDQPAAEGDDAVPAVTDTEAAGPDPGAETQPDAAETSEPAAGQEETPEAQEPEEDPEPEIDYGILSGFKDAGLLTPAGRAAAELLFEKGIVKGNDKYMLDPGKNITRAEFVTMLYKIKDAGAGEGVSADVPGDLSGIRISISAADVAPGGTLQATASFSGMPSGKACSAQWYFDDKPVSGYAAQNKVFTDESKSNFSWTPVFTRNMQLTHRVGLELTYPADNGDVSIYAEKVVNIQNYDQSHYNVITRNYTADVSEIFDSVRSSYQGNYKSSYNPDYLDKTKEDFVNGKGYSSRTGYLIWANLATQKVNIFTGSKGNWKICKSFRCASGARSTPTPQGVTYVTYKQTGWYTSSYVCKPVVRFYPGTGYAFHSYLYTADGKRVKDGTMGYPVSHGCLRMEPSGIQWIYDNIPVNTAVVIY